MATFNSLVVVDASAGDGNVNITVPTADYVIALWSFWEGDVGDTLSTLTINSVSMFPAEQNLADGANGSHAGGGASDVIVSPAAGTQNVAWTWGNGSGRTNGGAILLFFLDLETGSNTMQVESSAIDGHASNQLDIDLTSETTSLIITAATSYDANSGINETATLRTADPIDNIGPIGLFTRGYTLDGSATSTNITAAGESYGCLVGVSIEEVAGSTTVTGTGVLASQAATASGSGEVSRVGSGVLTAQAVSLTGVGELIHTAQGALTAQAHAVVGSGTATSPIVVSLTAANNRELRDETNTLIASLNGIIWEWYDNPSSTAGNPTDSGTFNTDASGEATITLTNSTLTTGQFGQLIIYHPTNADIRAIFRVPVS